MPSLGFNRLAYGDRFKTIFPSHNPPTFWQLRLGASADAKVSDNSAVSTVKRQEVILDFYHGLRAARAAGLYLRSSV